MTIKVYTTIEDGAKKLSQEVLKNEIFPNVNLEIFEIGDMIYCNGFRYVFIGDFEVLKIKD